ncbi:hypothetical protein P9112_005029 [Eukaryota sp. TZLM1-RC]
MMNLDIKKHIKFTIIRLCFSSNFNHIFRSTNPLVTRPLAQKFNELRAKVLSQLLGCKMFQIPDHAYLSPQYGGLGWTKASILTSCAFVGGCRNAIFERKMYLFEFFMLKICYTGRITHILRSCAPSIALDFCRSFNSLRTEFFADLLDVEPGMLKSHLFSSANLGGIGFTKSSILCQSAFLGGGKNFIYEFSRRFPDDSHLLVPNCSPYLYELSCELEKLPPQIWTKCFPQSIQEIPNRSLFNLQFCCKKLQQKLSKIFESLDFDVRLGLAKKKNPAFANLFTRYV